MIISRHDGQYVVLYYNDAYGNVVSQMIDNTSEKVGQLNPFRYKGYYYDEEIDMYYCQTRYYVPTWRRWLNYDNPSFLEFDNINGMNLFAYCGNNPVMYSDGTGCAADFVLDLFFLGWSIVDVIKDPTDWKNWAAVGLDLAFTAIPFATGGSKLIKLANVGENLSDFSKVTVIGYTMKRVETVSQFVNATDNLYDGFSAYEKLSKVPIIGKVLAETGGKTSNLAWLYTKVQSGYKIVDIGIDIGRVSKSGKLVRSSSYIAEKIFLGFWKYRNIWKLPYHIF